MQQPPKRVGQLGQLHGSWAPAGSQVNKGEPATAQQPLLHKPCASQDMTTACRSGRTPHPFPQHAPAESATPACATVTQLAPRRQMHRALPAPFAAHAAHGCRRREAGVLHLSLAACMRCREREALGAGRGAAEADGDGGGAKPSRNCTPSHLTWIENPKCGFMLKVLICTCNTKICKKACSASLRA